MIKQRVTAQKRNRIFLCFKNDLTATQAADICGVNRNTANRYYNLLRRAILSESIREAKREVGEQQAGRVVLRREARAGEARARGCGKDAGVRAAQARGQGVRDGRARLLEGVAHAGHQGSNP